MNCLMNFNSRHPQHTRNICFDFNISILKISKALKYDCIHISFILLSIAKSISFDRTHISSTSNIAKTIDLSGHVVASFQD